MVSMPVCASEVRNVLDSGNQGHSTAIKPRQLPCAWHTVLEKKNELHQLIACGQSQMVSSLVKGLTRVKLCLKVYMCIMLVELC